MRQSGVLLHISSLPSPYGIGTLGMEAIQFIDFLSGAGQHFWQVLPVSPTGYGDSPYQSFSSYAGNPYFIDLDALCEEGLLQKSDYCGLNWGDNPERVDFGLLYQTRFKVLQKAVSRFLGSDTAGYFAFCEKNAYWLDDYALFMALKDSHGGAPWRQWENPLRSREEVALRSARTEFAEAITFYKTLQFFFFHQWDYIKNYANDKGISIIGDLPIYVAPDSADVWSKPWLFELAPDLSPTSVAGCPPDGFCADGQLWGNPLYNWNEHSREGFSWWISRIRHQFDIYDVLRIDHFRGFDGYYAIPYGAENAKDGAWRQGPGMALFEAVKNALGDKHIIAEDLGYLSSSVRKLLRDSGYPGMKVLHFAFGGGSDNDYLPHNFIQNCVAYTGTHDNTTTAAWFQTASDAERSMARDYLQIHNGENPVKAMLSALWASVADLAIAPMQDILELGAQARMNTPSTLGGNWQWRLSPQSDLAESAVRLRHMTQLYGRL